MKTGVNYLFLVCLRQKKVSFVRTNNSKNKNNDAIGKRKN